MKYNELVEIYMKKTEEILPKNEEGASFILKGDKYVLISDKYWNGILEVVKKVFEEIADKEE